MRKFIQTNWFNFLILLIAGFLLYSKSFYFGLTYLDDNVWFLDYRWYLKDIHNISKIFLQPDILFNDLFYRPMISLLFILETQINNDHFWVYRLSNIIIHIINSYFVFILLKKLSYDWLISFWFSLIFLVHPVLTGSVVWIPGRTDSLLAIFVLASFICFISYIKENKIRFLLGHALGLMGALFTKETAVVVPFVCFLYFFCIFKEKTKFRILSLIAIAWIIVIGIWAVLRKLSLEHSTAVPLSIALKSLFENLIVLVNYLGKAVVPRGLSVLPVLLDLRYIQGTIVCVALVILLIRKGLKRLNYIFFGFSWFVIFLLPSLVISQLFHEYRIYLSLIGIMILVLETNIFQDLLKKNKSLCVSIFLLIITIFSLISFIYSHEFSGKYPFWLNAVRTSPHSPLAHRNLGAMYFLDEKYDLSKKEFLKTLELNPQEPMVYNNLGLIYNLENKPQEAQAAYLKEIEINPTYDNVYYNQGLLYARYNHYEEAAQSWQKAFELNPRNIGALKLLADYYFYKKDFEKADALYKELQLRGVAVTRSVSSN